MEKMLLRSSHFLVIVCVCAVVFISGCAKYTPHTFSRPIGGGQSLSGVSVVASKLSEPDCRYYFSRRILSKGFQPIQLMIKNNTNRSYFMNAADMSVAIEDNFYVARRLHLNPTKRFISWAIPGLCFGIFFIPALVDPLCSIKANDKLNDDFRSRTFGPTSIITVAPQSTINRVFFTRSCDSVSFLKMTLRDKHNDRELVFEVDLD